MLAVDTHTYWRLMLAHLGMPQWQALVAGQGLTPWARVSSGSESRLACVKFACGCFR